MNLQPPPFNMIKSGAKTIELRLNDEKRQKVKAGDEIEFVNTENDELRLLAIVKAVHKFSSFEELYKSLSLLKCGYTEAELPCAKASDMDIYYPKEKQAKYGVLGIEINLI